MQDLAKRVANLLTVRSIVTIGCMLAFIYLSIAGKINSGEFMTVFSVIIGFYFGTQKEKDNQKDT